jgi:hypothetical protein
MTKTLFDVLIAMPSTSQYAPCPADHEINVLRWRYEDHNKRAVWLAFDPGFLCIYCNKPVLDLSMGGAALCPSCDAGDFPGDKYDWANLVLLQINARDRLLALPDDPVWAVYEKDYQDRKYIRKHMACVGGGPSQE